MGAQTKVESDGNCGDGQSNSGGDVGDLLGLGGPHRLFGGGDRREERGGAVGDRRERRSARGREKHVCWIVIVSNGCD